MDIGSRTSAADLIRELLRPWYIRLGGLLFTGLPLYDVACNQFGWPKVPRLLGMTISALPWWAWLIPLLLLIQAAMFDYVRRLPSLLTVPDPNGSAAPPGDNAGLGTRITDAQNRIAGLLEAVDNDRAAATDAIARVSEDLRKVEGRIAELAEGAKNDRAAADAGYVNIAEEARKAIEATNRKVADLYDLTHLREMYRPVRVASEAVMSIVETGDRPALGDALKRYTLAVQMFGHRAMGISGDILFHKYRGHQVETWDCEPDAADLDYTLTRFYECRADFDKTVTEVENGLIQRLAIEEPA